MSSPDGARDRAMGPTRIHSVEIAVGADAIDENRHVNNTAYVRWMQDVAVAHSARQGWPMGRYFEAGATWVVRSHYVEYLRPAFESDRLRVATWVSDLHDPRSTRRYVFWRDGERRPVARAETLWVFVDLATGRPCPIPRDLASAFSLLPDEAAVHRELGLTARSGGLRRSGS